MESVEKPEGNFEDEKSELSPKDYKECYLFSKDGADSLKELNIEYNAIEFRVDMFLNKLCSSWVLPSYEHSKLSKYYIGEDVPQSLLETHEIKHENIEYYKECINRGVSLIRTVGDIPIIYTVRSDIDGGFLNTSNGWDIYNELVLFGAITLNGEIIDIEFQYESNIQGIVDIIDQCEYNLILMSKHFIKHGTNLFDYQQLASSLKIYESKFDIIKLCTNLKEGHKVFENIEFTQPMVLITLGEKMKITRVTNKYLTPVYSDKLTKEKTGPGQMTKDEIMEIRTKLGLTDSEKLFYILGDPISYSPSPTFHNAVFSLLSLPYHYKRFETDSKEGALYIINKDQTVGCSVTIPLKRELYFHFKDHASEDVKYIQAINTIVKIAGKIRVYNTDWIAIYNLLNTALAKISFTQRSNKILILGTGGTSLAAIYAVQKLNMIPVIYNRKSNFSKTQEFMRDLVELGSTVQYGHDISLFKYTNDFSEFTNLFKCEKKVAEESIDKLAEEILSSKALISTAQRIDGIVSGIPGVAGFTFQEDLADILLTENTVVFDASYIPKETDLLKQAKSHKGTLIKGVEMLICQAWEQSKLFTGKEFVLTDSQREEVEKSVYEFYEGIKA